MSGAGAICRHQSAWNPNQALSGEKKKEEKEPEERRRNLEDERRLSVNILRLPESTGRNGSAAASCLTPNLLSTSEAFGAAQLSAPASYSPCGLGVERQTEAGSLLCKQNDKVVRSRVKAGLEGVNTSQRITHLYNTYSHKYERLNVVTLLVSL